MPQWPPCCSSKIRSETRDRERDREHVVKFAVSHFYHIISCHVFISEWTHIRNDLQHIVWKMVSCIWFRLNLFPALSRARAHAQSQSERPGRLTYFNRHMLFMSDVRFFPFLLTVIFLCVFFSLPFLNLWLLFNKVDKIG